MKPVGRRSGQRRAEVVVANREGVGQGVVEGNVVAIVVPHRERHVAVLVVARRLRLEPLVAAAAAAGVDLVGPRVGKRPHPGGVGVFDVQPERHVAGAGVVGLDPDGVAVGERDRPRVAQTPHAAQRAEGVVERAVLLHQDHHMLGVEKRAAGVGSDRHGSLDRTVERGPHAGAGEESRLLDEVASRIHEESVQVMKC